MARAFCTMTLEEATLVQNMSSVPEEPWVIAGRANVPAWEAAQLLEEMARKGLVFAFSGAGSAPKYHHMGRGVRRAESVEA